MATLQSRAGHRPAQRHANNDEAEQPAGVQIRGRPQQQRIIREQDSWILFAPVKPAQAQLTEHSRSPIDSRTTPSASQAQATSYDAQTQDATLDSSETPANGTQTSHIAIPLLPPLPSSVNETAGETSIPSPTISHDTTTLPSPETSSLGRWTVLPTPNASYAFDDEQDTYTSPVPSREEHSPVESLRVAGSAVSANTELLSIPSSVTLSERSASTDASPRRAHAVAGSARHRQEPSDALTVAALEKMTGAVDNISTEEADLTSGSEEEDAMDVDEALLARAPDAMSAGIRPIKRAPLQHVSVSATSQLSGQQYKRSEVCSARLSTSSKRRHRQAGTSEKGSKRSQTNTEASVAARSAKGKTVARDRETRNGSRRRRSRRHTFSLGEAARQIFKVDQEVFDAFNQHGTVYSQSLPQDPHPSLYSGRSLHGLEAFSAHAAAELGGSPHAKYQFTGSDIADCADCADAALYDGDDATTLRGHFENREAYSDAHTASLGLQRHFSLSSLHHFLVESVYKLLYHP